MISELGLNDVYVTSLLMSKSVLWRYQQDVDVSSEGWAAVQRIMLHCVTPGSGEVARTEFEYKDLHDTVMVGELTV